MPRLAQALLVEPSIWSEESLLMLLVATLASLVGAVHVAAK